MRNQFGLTISIVFLFTIRLFAANIPLTVVSVTSQQAEIQYTSTISGACTLSLTDNSGLGVTVWDLNGAKFANANQDLSRPDTLVNGRNRKVLLGHRVYQQGTDQNIYSMSLQADAPHTLTVTCGSDSGTVQFATKTIQQGTAYPELPQFCPAGGMWNHCWPTIDYSVAGKEVGYVDAFTGALVKRVTGPGENQARLVSASAFSYAKDQSGSSAWTNPLNAAAYSASGPYASTSVTNAKLFIGWGQLNYNGAPFGGFQTYNADSIDDAQLRLHASSSDGLTPVSACVSLDGQTCYSPTITHTPSSSAKDITYGDTGGTWPASSWPGPFSGWGAMQPPPRHLLNSPQLAVSVNGTAVTIPTPAYATGVTFDSEWVAGTPVFISGSSPACANNICTIASVTDTTHLTINENPGNIGAQTAQPTAGFLVWKTSGSGTISLNANFDYAHSVAIVLPGAGGESPSCSLVPDTTSVTLNDTPITGAPHTGSLCYFGFGSVYFFDETAGSSRYLDSNFFYLPALGAAGNVPISFNPFDPVDPRTWYNYLPNVGTPVQSLIFKSRYTGDYSDNPMQWPSGVGNADYANVTQTQFTPSYPNDIGSKFTALINSCCPIYIAALHATPPFVSSAPTMSGFLSNGYVAFFNGPGQDSIGWVFPFNLQTGQFSGVLDTFSNPTGRWGTNHSTKPSGANGYNWFYAENLAKGGLGLNGPWVAPVTQVWRSADGVNGTWDNTTCIPDPINSRNCTSTTSPVNYAYSCPASTSAYWTTTQADANNILLQTHGGGGGPYTSPFYGQNNCVQVRLGGEPCVAAANTAPGEIGAFPCPWDTTGHAYLQDLAVGDSIIDPNGRNCGDCEKDVVVQITKNSTTDIQVWLYRVAAGGGTVASGTATVPYPGPPVTPGINSMSPGQLGHVNGWSVQATVPGWTNQAWWYNATNPAAGWVKDTYLLAGSHPDLTSAQPNSLFAYCATATGGYNCRKVENVPRDFGTLNNNTVTGYSPYFNNSQAPNFMVTSVLETYPSAKQYNAGADLKRWLADYHDPTNGEAPGVENPQTSYTGQVVTGPVGSFSHVYDITLPTSAFFDVKNSPLYANSGRFRLQDISGPNAAINDSAVNTMCWARVANQCWSGSTAGHVYINAKAIEPSVTCYVNQFAISSPCVTPTPAIFGQSVINNVFDLNPEGQNYIRFTGMFNPPMNSGHYEHLRLVADGTWGFYVAAYAAGYRYGDIFAVRIPKIATDTVNRTTFVQVPVKLAAGNSASIRFGYDQSFRCHGVTDSQGNFISGYNDSCLITSAPNSTTPYTWASEGAPVTTPCSNGCTLNIPAISGRYLYYRVERYSPSGQLTYQGPTQRLPVP